MGVAEFITICAEEMSVLEASLAATAFSLFCENCAWTALPEEP